MPIETKGFDGLIGDITKMANALNTDSEGAPAARRILQAAAVPIDAQMKANASRDPKIISGKLRGAISTGKVKKHKRTGLHITKVTVGSIDLLKDSAVIKIEYENDGGGGSHINNTLKIPKYEWQDVKENG